MSVISGSGGASGMGALSSSSEASAFAHSVGSSGAGSGSMCFAKRSSRECTTASVTAKLAVAVGAQATPTSRPRMVFDAEDWRHHALFVARLARTTCFVVGGSTARREGKRPVWPRWRGCCPHTENYPRLSLSAWIEHVARVVASCRIVAVVSQPFSDVA